MPRATDYPLSNFFFPSGDIELCALRIGEGPLVLLYHGFPDTAHSFVPVMRHLADAGYRAVAPFLRGYAPSSLAPDGDYRLPRLADDVLACMDALDESEAALVGHDWGAAAAYMTAARAPERINTMVTAGLPHLRRFFLSPTLRQLRRSRYILNFQFPGAVARFANDNALQNLLREWSPRWDFSEEDVEPVRAQLDNPERAKALLRYYRHIPRALASPSIMREALRPTPVPVTMVAGADDGCIGMEMFTGQEALFPAGIDLHVVPGAGHFMHREQPDTFASILLRTLGAPGN